MKITKLIALIVMVVMQSGCTTMKMLGEAGDEFDKGNYGSGVFSGALALLAGPVIDVVTLGGVVDPASGVNVINSINSGDYAAANGYINQGSNSNSGYSPVRPDAVRDKTTVPTVNNGNKYSLPGGTATPEIVARGEGSNSIAQGNGPKVTRSLNECIKFDTASNAMGDFLVNSCGERVFVKFFDDGYCRSGCGDDVGGYKKSSITKMKGHVKFAVCQYPSSPSKSSNGFVAWPGSGSFWCLE